MPPPWMAGRSSPGSAGHAAGARDRGEPDALLEHARKGRVGVAIEVEQPQGRVVTDRRQLWRDPRQHRRRTAHDQRRDRPDRKGLPAMRIDMAARLQCRQRAVEPAAYPPRPASPARFRARPVRRNASARDRVSRPRARLSPGPPDTWRWKFGIAGFSAKNPSSGKAGVAPSKASPLSPRSFPHSGSPTGATTPSPSSAPRNTMTSSRGSRPSARATRGTEAQANSTPEPSNSSRLVGA